MTILPWLQTNKTSQPLLLPTQQCARIVYDRLRTVPGLMPVMPRGAMYIMVGIDSGQFRDIANDFDFVQKLLKEQSVFCLPASAS